MYAFGKALFAEFCEFELTLGPIWGPFRNTFLQLLKRFSGYDLKLIFEMLFGGAGGRGGVPEASESEESSIKSKHAATPEGVWRL